MGAFLRSCTALSLTWLVAVTMACSPQPADGNDDDSSQPSLLWSEDCPPDQPELRRLDVGTVNLHVACIGSGPTLVMLHGFPEYWYGGWEVARQLATDFRVLLPDQRGYNLSDKPVGLDNYRVPALAEDIVGLLAEVSEEPVLLMAHDWGGVVGWLTGAEHGEWLRGLIIANAPHPIVFARELAENPDQQSASSYVNVLTADDAEDSLSANDFGLLSYLMDGVLSDDELTLYKQAWAQPGALTAMLNWYRANFDGLTPVLGDSTAVVDVPTLVLWGMQDTALLPGNLVGLDDYVTDLQIEQFPEASHWILHEQPEDVAASVRAFAERLD